jgi:hypothetical protein
MDLATVFRGDRFRLVSGIACNTLNIPSQVVSSMEEATNHVRRPAIVAWPCNDRLATQDAEQKDIT